MMVITRKKLDLIIEVSEIIKVKLSEDKEEFTVQGNAEAPGINTKALYQRV